MVELSPFRVITDLKNVDEYFVEWFWFEPMDRTYGEFQTLRDPNDPTAATWNPPRQARIDGFPQNYFDGLGPSNDILQVYSVSKTYEDDNYVRLEGISFKSYTGQVWTLNVSYQYRFDGWAERYPGTTQRPNKKFAHAIFRSSVRGVDFDQHIPAAEKAKFEFGVSRHGPIRFL